MIGAILLLTCLVVSGSQAAVEDGLQREAVRRRDTRRASVGRVLDVVDEAWLPLEGDGHDAALHTHLDWLTRPSVAIDVLVYVVAAPDAAALLGALLEQGLAASTPIVAEALHNDPVTFDVHYTVETAPQSLVADVRQGDRDRLLNATAAHARSIVLMALDSLTNNSGNANADSCDLFPISTPQRDDTTARQVWVNLKAPLPPLHLDGVPDLLANETVFLQDIRNDTEYAESLAHICQLVTSTVLIAPPRRARTTYTSTVTVWGNQEALLDLPLLSTHLNNVTAHTLHPVTLTHTTDDPIYPPWISSAIQLNHSKDTVVNLTHVDSLASNLTNDTTTHLIVIRGQVVSPLSSPLDTIVHLTSTDQRVYIHTTPQSNAVIAILLPTHSTLLLLPPSLLPCSHRTLPIPVSLEHSLAAHLLTALFALRLPLHSSSAPLLFFALPSPSGPLHFTPLRFLTDSLHRTSNLMRLQRIARLTRTLELTIKSHNAPLTLIVSHDTLQRLKSQWNRLIHFVHHAHTLMGLDAHQRASHLLTHSLSDLHNHLTQVRSAFAPSPLRSLIRSSLAFLRRTVRRLEPQVNLSLSAGVLLAITTLLIVI